jgi:hypothetical protein
MTPSEMIFGALTAGSPAPLRAYPDVMPDNPVFPLVTFMIVAGEDDMHLDGDSGTARRLVQVDAWGRTRLGVEAIIATAKAQMLAASNFTVARVDVSGAPRFEPDSRLYRESLEFSIHFET